MVRLDANDNDIGYGPADGSPSFWFIKPFNREPASHGNGAQVIIEAHDADTVDRFHQAAMDAGGPDEGSPGLRDHTPGYYGAYIRDLDGNKMHIVVMLET